MRIILFFFCTLTITTSESQSLRNTEWFQAIAEKTDGSTTVNRLQPGYESVKYFFTDNKVLISLNDQYSAEEKFAVDGGQLLIGDFVKFHIDSLSDQYLILSDVPKKGVLASRLTKYTYVNTEYLFSYMKQNQLLRIIGDSAIEATHLFSPSYQGSITEILMEKFHYEEIQENLHGSFTIARDGGIANILISPSKQIPVRGMVAIINAIRSTQGKWIMPPTPKPYDYNMKFELNFSYIKPMNGMNFRLL